MVQLPIFLKWNTNEDEAECTFEWQKIVLIAFIETWIHECISL
jgi:hypothetical protein